MSSNSRSTNQLDCSVQTKSSDNGEQIDVEALMNRIRSEVQSSLKDVRQRFPRPEGAQAKLFDGLSSSLHHSDELNFLHAHWTNWLEPPQFSSHRKYIGPVILKFKRFLAGFVMEVLFKGYFKQLYDFNWNLVQYLNKVAQYVDARDSKLFWELIKKIDNDIAAVNDKCDRLYDEIFVSLSRLEQVSLSSVTPVSPCSQLEAGDVSAGSSKSSAAKGVSDSTQPCSSAMKGFANGES